MIELKSMNNFLKHDDWINGNGMFIFSSILFVILLVYACLVLKSLKLLSMPITFQCGSVCYDLYLSFPQLHHWYIFLSHHSVCMSICLSSFDFISLAHKYTDMLQSSSKEYNMCDCLYIQFMTIKTLTNVTVTLFSGPYIKFLIVFSCQFNFHGNSILCLAASSGKIEDKQAVTAVGTLFP